MIELSKICTACHQAKPLAEFHRQQNSPDGHVYKCRDCKRAYMRARQAIPEARRRQYDHLLEAAMIGEPAPAVATITLIVPVWKGRRFKLALTPDVAGWLRDQLTDALGEPKPKPRRQPRLRRGRWVTGRTAR